MKKVKSFETKEKAIEFAVEHWLDCGKQAIENHGAFFVALSGGSTPKAIFQVLATKKDALDWSRVHLFWSDERSVSPDDPDSNYHMAMHSGLEKLPIDPAHIYRMVAEDNIEQNALEYENHIKTTLLNRPFDLIMLGMGDDGHTASLFPETSALTITDRLVVANPVPQKKTTRMTFTYPLINAAANIAIYVLGHGKATMLKQVLAPDSPYPISGIGTPASPALYITDININ
ncbi:MAG: 6-phosphogluconolactonase [Simkaniaceae bacterium]|nr:6-phosphogluconolactonase [Simkaniaceae bacterium]